MTDARRALLGGLIDDAGLFPPAALELDVALERHLAALGGPDAWLLGRFVSPAARLEQLVSQLEARREGLVAPVLLSLILDAAPTERAATERLAFALADLTGQAGRLEGLGVIGALEQRLPDDLWEPGAPIAVYLAETARRLDEAGFGDRPVFVERGLSGARWREGIEALAAALGALNGVRRPTDGAAWGLKLRCGGAEARAVPDPASVAAAVALCHREGVPFKATAGLHHPVRRHDDALGVAVHGFLNVFGGAALHAAGAVDEGQLAEVLRDDDPSSFHLAGDLLTWRDRAVTAAEIGELRRTLATSFGSCSLDEPREGLRELGLLGREET